MNHGFRSGFSCETQLLITTDPLAKNTEKGMQTDVAILDFSKAFDTVPHKKLLHKLKSYGVRGALLVWIESFLCNRHMRVVVMENLHQRQKFCRVYIRVQSSDHSCSQEVLYIIHLRQRQAQAGLEKIRISLQPGSNFPPNPGCSYNKIFIILALPLFMLQLIQLIK